ncbi:hypothetical protein DRW41_17285 [Neobacillus piezotolerans]|uniref:Uncharacterized protein n=1 Tax=Neobacillus piezotolerans TaxID=2259171 RepID=A0A3D8GM39_9BACI|nr:hypothetical protein DRW41_17285 [Neobacillus piezotolerans]
MFPPLIALCILLEINHKRQGFLPADVSLRHGTPAPYSRLFFKKGQKYWTFHQWATTSPDGRPSLFCQINGLYTTI